MTSWYGVAAHYLKGVRYVSANGTIDHVDNSSNPDLMWAMRGGG